MKINIRFFTIATSLLLVSVILLTGGMAIIANSSNEARTYDPDSMPNILHGKDLIEADGPKSQAEMQKKFEQYVTVSEMESVPQEGESQPTVATFFTQKQAEELKARRDRGELFSLSYDEILYIIGDSIDKYFANDHIILTNATGSDYIPVIRKQRSPDHHITCYHGDFTEFLINYDPAVPEALNVYYKMIQDISDIITYRIGMLDSTFVQVNLYESTGGKCTWISVADSEPVFIPRNISIIEDDIPDEPAFSRWIKLFTDTKNMSMAGYLDAVIYEQYNFISMYYQSIPNIDTVYSIFPTTEILAIDSYSCYITLYKTKESESLIYPTAELRSMLPDMNAMMYPMLQTELGDDGCYVCLNLHSGTWHMSSCVYRSHAISGIFERDGDRLLLTEYYRKDPHVYILEREEDHFVSRSENEDMGLSEGLVFHSKDGDAFWDILIDWTPPKRAQQNPDKQTVNPDHAQLPDSGKYELSEDERQKLYDVLIDTGDEWIDNIPLCDWLWEFKVEDFYGGKTLKLCLCDCKTLSDVTSRRSRKLRDYEWDLVMEILGCYPSNFAA